VFRKSLLVLFLLVIVSFGLRFMASDYLFGIFKLFLTATFFIEMTVPSEESKRSYICDRGIDFAAVSMISYIVFEAVRTV